MHSRAFFHLAVWHLPLTACHQLRVIFGLAEGGGTFEYYSIFIIQSDVGLIVLRGRVSILFNIQSEYGLDMKRRGEGGGVPGIILFIIQSDEPSYVEGEEGGVYLDL